MDPLPPWPLLSAFLAASLLLAVTPGPGVFYIITRTLAQGRHAGLASVLGVMLGNLGNAMGAAVGLGALFAVSSLAFLAVKYAGAAYLIYLGLKMLRTPAVASDTAVLTPVPVAKIFRDGLVVALLNPKTAIFFAAFLPQFMTPDRAGMLHSAVLGALFVAIAATTDTLYVLLASRLAPKLKRMKGGAGRRLAGLAFIGLGMLTAAGARPK